MSVDHRDSRILSAAEDLVEAVQRHALVAATDPDNAAAVVAEADRLSGAAARYAATTFEETGWGSPFVHTDEPSPQREEAGTSGSIPQSDTVTVEVRYRVSVHDLRRAAALARDRAKKTGGPSCVDVEGQNPVDIVTALFLSDGWSPSSYDQEIVELIDEEWTCQPDRKRS